MLHLPPIVRGRDLCAEEARLREEIAALEKQRRKLLRQLQRVMDVKKACNGRKSPGHKACNR